jgi:hypothetical protein
MDFGLHKEHHLVNFLSLIRKDFAKDGLFSLNVPAKVVDSQKLEDPVSLIDELCLDKIVDPNSFLFRHSSDSTISEMFESIYLKGKIDGNSL